MLIEKLDRWHPNGTNLHKFATFNHHTVCRRKPTDLTGFAWHSFKAGHYFKVHSHTHARHAWFQGFFCFCFFFFLIFFSSFLVTDGAEPAPAHHSLLIWPSDEADDWGELGSWRIQMLNSRINFSSRGIWESDPLPWLSWQLGLTPSNPKCSFLF